jgi:hypothetical protein
MLAERDNQRKLDQATTDKLSKTKTITVILHRIKNIRWPRKSRAPIVHEPAAVPHGVSKLGTIPEKAVQKLGLSHHGGYVGYEWWVERGTNKGSVGAPQQKRTGKTYCYDDVDGKEDENAFATFIFKYRSLGTVLPPNIMTDANIHTSETLKALGVVPRTPSLTPPLQHSGASAQSAHKSGNTNAQDGLSKQELIAIIATYRGHGNGLENLSQKGSKALLQHHRLGYLYIPSMHSANIL